MDAVKFVEERRRMLAVAAGKPKYNLFSINTRAEDVVKEVEEWSAAHPRKTRQSVFLEQWPEAVLVDDIININPCSIVATHRLKIECYKTSCKECRCKFWMQEVE